MEKKKKKKKTYARAELLASVPESYVPKNMHASITHLCARPLFTYISICILSYLCMRPHIRWTLMLRLVVNYANNSAGENVSGCGRRSIHRLAIAGSVRPGSSECASGPQNGRNGERVEKESGGAGKGNGVWDYEKKEKRCKTGALDVTNTRRCWWRDTGGRM